MDAIHRKCFNHPERESVALCPECERCFCRECVTDYHGRAVCASCLERIAKKERRREQFHLRGLLHAVQVMAGMVVVYVFFYCAGQALLTLSTHSHEDTLWQASPWSEDE